MASDIRKQSLVREQNLPSGPDSVAFLISFGESLAIFLSLSFPICENGGQNPQSPWVGKTYMRPQCPCLFIYLVSCL